MIKSHVVESRISLLFWPCLLLTEKQRTVNHITIFNDSVSKFYQWNVQNSLRQSLNTKAFAEVYLFFLVSTLAKKGCLGN